MKKKASKKKAVKKKESTVREKCSWSGCRKKASNKVGRKWVCGNHVTFVMAASAISKKRVISIRAKPGDKKGQEAMTRILNMMAGRGDVE